MKGDFERGLLYVHACVSFVYMCAYESAYVYTHARVSVRMCEFVYKKFVKRHMKERVYT